MEQNFASLLDTHSNLFPIGLVATPGAERLASLIDSHLLNFYYSQNPDAISNDAFRKTLICKSDCPRFSTGDGKAVLGHTVRGYDLYILADVGNYSCTYPMFGKETPMSPDDHYQDIKRIISAISGKASRITVIMPILYGGRQHKRSMRESLDAALALQELERMGVSSIITFDAHDPRVQNATPLMGFDNAMPNYQVLKALFNRFDDINIDKDHLMLVSPDEGAMNRNVYYASILGLDLGMFYKRRDYTRVVNGRNPIVAHEYIGTDVKGRDILVADDIIASGDSMIGLAEDLKERGCGRIFMSATYALFTEGLERFDRAYEQGLFDAVLSTNLTYQSPEMLARPWYVNVDATKYISYFILAMHQNRSVNTLLDPHKKIHDLVAKYNASQGK